VSDWPLAQVL
jgi:hypothetical protein